MKRGIFTLFLLTALPAFAQEQAPVNLDNGIARMQALESNAEHERAAQQQQAEADRRRQRQQAAAAERKRSEAQRSACRGASAGQSRTASCGQPSARDRRSGSQLRKPLQGTAAEKAGSASCARKRSHQCRPRAIESGNGCGAISGGCKSQREQRRGEELEGRQSPLVGKIIPLIPLNNAHIGRP
nr:hypothetical protein [Burkholderia ubonensis]